MVTIGSKQAADILGISQFKVKGWTHKGLLHDIAVFPSGQRRHSFKFDIREVRALRDELKGIPPLERSIIRGPFRQPVVSPKPFSGLLTSLERIEQKLDKLINMWG